MVNDYRTFDFSNRDKWLFNKANKSILENKDEMLNQIISQMLLKTIKIFKYDNLPDTIKRRDIELLNQVNGFSVWKEVNGNLYVFNAGLGGEPNPYYLPTKAVIANPALRYNETLEIDKECVVMRNDYLYMGLMPLHNKYGNLLLEAELSLKYAILNARVPAIIQADNDNTAKSADEFFKKIYKGEDFGIITSKEFFDGIKSQDFYKQAYIKDLIESIQYIKGSWYNEIGLNSVFNMKREVINEAEATLNEDVLYPTVDVMLECRQEYLEKINKMFGTNITVELDSVWARNRLQNDLSIEKEKIDVEIIKKEAKADEGVEVNDTV